MNKIKLLLVKSSATLTILGLFTIFDSLNNEAIAWKDNFIATCRNVRLANNRYGDQRLLAECRDYNGNYKRASIDLDDNIFNEDGRLTYDVWKGAARRGNFSLTCRNIRLNKIATLYATCRKINGQWRETVLPLNKIYHNMNGFLTIDSVYNGMPGRLRGKY